MSNNLANVKALSKCTSYAQQAKFIYILYKHAKSVL